MHLRTYTVFVVLMVMLFGATDCSVAIVEKVSNALPKNAAFTIKVTALTPGSARAGGHVSIVAEDQFDSNCKVIVGGNEVAAELFKGNKRLGFTAPNVATARNVEVFVRNIQSRAESSRLYLWVTPATIRVEGNVTVGTIMPTSTPGQSINGVSPGDIRPGCYVVVSTDGSFDENCRAMYDNREMVTELFRSKKKLGFEVPGPFPPGTKTVEVYVKNTSTGTNSNKMQVRQVGDTPVLRIASFAPAEPHANLDPVTRERGNRVTLKMETNLPLSETKVWCNDRQMSADVDEANKSLTFGMDNNLELGKEYPVFVRAGWPATKSNTVNIRFVAPRGYRGVHAWKFDNGTIATTSWDLFRDSYGKDNVEFKAWWEPGQPWYHRLSAQIFYDLAYSKCADGGNCLGMCLRSIRTRVGDFQGTARDWYNHNRQGRVWDYGDASRDTAGQIWALKDGINEDQGRGISANIQILATHRKNTQNHNEAWEFIRDNLATGDPRRIPVLWVDKDGDLMHAVLAYKVEEFGSRRSIYIYDCNRPFHENLDDDDLNIAYVYKDSGDFSYDYPDGANVDHMIAFTYDELIRDTPALPSDPRQEIENMVGSATSGGNTVAIFSNPKAVTQITDERGRRMLNGGKLNPDNATRIPNASRFIPPSASKNFPAIYVFNGANGKNLTFQMEGSAPSQAAIFSPGSVTTLNAQRGQFRLEGIQTPNQKLVLPDPQAMNVQEIKMLSVESDGAERLFHIKQLQSPQKGDVTLKLEASNTKLNVASTSNAPVQFGLAVKSISRTGMKTRDLPSMAVPAKGQQSIGVE